MKLVYHHILQQEVEEAMEGGSANPTEPATEKTEDHPEESTAAGIETSTSTPEPNNGPPAAMEGEPTPAEHKEETSAKLETSAG